MRLSRARLIVTMGSLSVSLALLAAALFPTFRLKTKLKVAGRGHAFSIPHHESLPYVLATGDFNGDEHADLVAGSMWKNEYSNQLELFLGKGDGAFQPSSLVKLNARPQEIRVADLNGDGLSDLALITLPQSPQTEPGRLWIFLGTRAGPLHLPASISLPYEPDHVFIADFDNIGHLDVAVSTHRSSFWIFRGHGDGTFSDPVLACHCDVSFVADFNGDHRPDLVSPSGLLKTEVRLNRGNFTFAPPVPLSGRDPEPLVSSADLNRDGIPDLVLAKRDPPALSVYLGNGDGTFRSAGEFAAPEIHALELRDLDGDGFPDIIAAVWSRAAGELAIFPGRGDGTFAPPISLHTGYTPAALAIADFNSDRKPDLAVTSLGDQSLSVFLQSPVAQR